MAARTGKYAKLMKALMKAYKFDDKDTITTLCFQAQLKRGCDCSKVSEDIVFWIMPSFKKNKLASSLTVRMTLHMEDAATHRLPKACKELIFTYLEALNFLSKFYVTDFNIAKATSDLTCLRNASMVTSVQFAGVLRSMVIRCGNASSEKQAKASVFDSFPATSQSARQMS